MKIIKKTPNFSMIIFLLLIGIILLLSGCTQNEITNEKTSVLVTIIPQLEMVTSIGGEYVDVTVMVPAGESPHSFELTPNQMIKIAQASAYFTVGSGVEFELTNMETILEQNQDLTLFDCSQNIDIISFDEHYGREHYIENDQEENNEEDDHDHSGTDPHVWTSPINYKKMAEVVYEGLIEIDSSHQDIYFSNYQIFISSIDSLHENISTRLAPFNGNSFMVYHPAWGYFGDTYNLSMIAIEDEGKQPGPAGLAAIINQTRNQNISVIFVTPQFDTTSAQTIADEIDGVVAYADPLTTDYKQTLQNLAQFLISGYS
jgi:zinc transport system substrate-binding protein